MSLLSSAPARPANSLPPHVRAALTATCIAAAALAGGCSSARTADTTHRQWVGAVPAPVPGQLVAEAYKPEPGDPIKEAPVEPASRRAEPDDPSEPFSPNYGRTKTTRALDAVSRRIATVTN